MKKVLSVTVLAGALLALTACGGSNGRFIGFDKCSRDGSPVWYEYPNAQGSFDGLDNKAEYCNQRR